MLDRIASYKEKTESLKAKVRKAMTYPIAVVVVAVIVSGILLIKVVPQFQTVFAGFGAELPAFTMFVIHISEVVQAYWLLFLLGIAAAIAGFTVARRRSKPLRDAIDRTRAEAAGRRQHHRKIGRRALCTNAVDDVCRGRAAGRRAEFGRRRDRQLGFRQRGVQSSRRRLHRPTAELLDAQHRRVPEHGDSDGRHRRRVRRAGYRCSTSRRRTTKNRSTTQSTT